MKLLMTAILLFAAFSSASAQQKNWETFVSSEGGFSILMPEKPYPNIVEVNTSKGQKRSNTFSYTDKDLNEYLVAYSKFRETKTTEIDYEAKFARIEKGLLIADPGKIRSRIPITLDGNPGRELTVEHPDGRLKTHRFYFAGDYFYQLSVEIQKPEAGDETSARFLNSFRLANTNK